jgi:peroxiredoxin Q/BCP
VEACSFRDAFPRFGGLDAVILGASPDSAESHRKFKAKYNLPFTLLVDEDHAIARAYGVWVEKNTFGAKRMGIARSTFIIDPAGKIARVFEKVDPAGHAQQVSEALKELQSAKR